MRSFSKLFEAMDGSTSEIGFCQRFNWRYRYRVDGEE